ncbi:MAG: proline--tRNA ligase, partial [Gammaproteobacteria bacterium]|nr:proline--tRNA ligase [Gammaproteobacteria bacterium]NIU03712.1 proline--tRNA ligase [Gammaproteobacteria bacterium]NIW54423.1 proline--tRNA ligase [Gammaproteobacteria bacterium]NIW86741.1 proline--tRNA ligase [Gammaproteobacteria bacterium]NIX84986.1 proline--tRNA ligase [Gammaproteobacteria bacterium]
GGLLEEIQAGLLARTRAFRDEHTRDIDSWDEFVEFFTPRNPEKPEVHGGFARAHWCGEADVERKINEELSVTIRCIPLEDEP